MGYHEIVEFVIKQRDGMLTRMKKAQQLYEKCPLNENASELEVFIAVAQASLDGDFTKLDLFLKSNEEIIAEIEKTRQRHY